MSYRVAHVRFAQDGPTYPVNCYRSDLGPGDVVIIGMPDRDPTHKVAEVDRVEFLNWRCKNTILCKRSEYRRNSDGGYHIERETKSQVVETIEQLLDELRNAGWHDFHNVSNVYRHVLFKRVETSVAAIGIRRNGIDFQVLDELAQELHRFPQGSRNLVRHNFYESKRDLLEFSKEFAINAFRPIDELTTYFEPLGRKQPRPTRDRDDLQDIRSAIGEAMTDTERAAFRSW